MGGILLFLVIVNAFVTGWLLAQVRSMKRTIGGVAKVQRDMAIREPVSRSVLDEEI